MDMCFSKKNGTNMPNLCALNFDALDFKQNSLNLILDCFYLTLKILEYKNILHILSILNYFKLL